MNILWSGNWPHANKDCHYRVAIEQRDVPSDSEASGSCGPERKLNRDTERQRDKAESDLHCGCANACPRRVCTWTRVLTLMKD